MNTIQKGITILLRCAVTGETLPLPEGFQMEEALPLIRSHGIVTLAYEGAVHCGVDQNLPVMRVLFQSYCQMMLQSERQCRAIDRLFAAFQENKIDFMPLKGCRMKTLYPRPELRGMGDADVLIRMEQYAQQIKPVMEELGFEYTKETDPHFTWTSKSLCLELHQQLISSADETFCSYFGDSWNLAVPETGTCYAMTAEDEFLFLFTHFARHFKDGGIGCRHVTDLWVYLRSHPELEEAQVCAGMSRLDLLAFYQNIRALMGVWFEDGVPNERTEVLEEFLFASGNWGKMETHVIAHALRQVLVVDNRKAGKIAYLVSLAFPDFKSMANQYPILRKMPWILPVVWIYRLFDKLLFEHKKPSHYVQRLKLIDQEKLEDHIQFLRFVGLGKQLEP